LRKEKKALAVNRLDALSFDHYTVFVFEVQVKKNCRPVFGLKVNDKKKLSG